MFNLFTAFILVFVGKILEKLLNKLCTDQFVYFLSVCVCFAVLLSVYNASLAQFPFIFPQPIKLDTKIKEKYDESSISRDGLGHWKKTFQKKLFSP